MSFPLVAVVNPGGAGVVNFQVNQTCKGFIYAGYNTNGLGVLTERSIRVSPDSPGSTFASTGNTFQTPVDSIPLVGIGSSFKLCKASNVWYFTIPPNTIGQSTHYFIPITDDFIDNAPALLTSDWGDN